AYKCEEQIKMKLSKRKAYDSPFTVSFFNLLVAFFYKFFPVPQQLLKFIPVCTLHKKFTLYCTHDDYSDRYVKIKGKWIILFINILLTMFNIKWREPFFKVFNEQKVFINSCNS